MFSASKTAGPSGYAIQRSVRLRSSASAYFNRTLTTPTNGKIWTWSAWAKLGAIGTREVLFCGASSTNVNYISIDNFTTANANFGLTYANSGTVVNVASSNLLRDPSSWYHLMVVYDSTSATSTITGSSTDRVRLYINGVQVTSFSATTAPALNATLYINAANSHAIGRREGVNDQYFDGYLTEINFIDGQALTPTSFGTYNSTTGVWQPKAYSGTYGTNGFFLNFRDNTSTTTLGYDYSGNSNNWTANNVSLTAGVTYDSMTDVPTLTSSNAANFSVLNPLKSAAAPTAGNLQVASPQVYGSRATMAVSSGKWYWEVTATTTTSFSTIGVLPATIPLTVDAASTSSSCSAYYVSGIKFLNGVSSAYGAAWTSGDIIGVALDCDSNTIQFYKNNAAQGSFSLYTSAGTEIQPFVCDENNAGSVFNINFGQRPFTYTPPTGYNRLCTFNLPTATIPNGAAQFAASLYTGTGSSLSVTNGNNNTLGTTFQPDFVWIKGRSGATAPADYDAVRGTTKQLIQNSNAAETTEATGLTAFNSNGFTVGALAALNTNAATYVAWQWKESATAGFDIVTYTGNGTSQNISHNLGVAPKLIIVKPRSGIGDWITYSSTTGAGNYLLLNSTAASAANVNVWNNTAPTSSVFSVGTSTGTNQNTTTYVAYCFSEIAGFSKFGSYTGNASADGPFVYCGFRPRFIVIKESSAARGWIQLDTSRDPYNVAQNYLFIEASSAEGSTTLIDILSNGFKVRSTNLNVNDTTSSTFIFFAFAENPFNYSLAR